MKNILENASIIDVRQPGEYAQGHYDEAINIPLGELPQRIEELKAMKQPLVLYCRSGNRSAMAVALLKQSGLTNVYNAGGLDELIKQKKASALQNYQ